MYEFTPYSAILGGALIGLSAAILLLGIGRQAGASGIFGGLFTLSGLQQSWRLAFVGGLLVPPLFLWSIEPTALTDIQISSNLWLLILAGLLTGFGTQLGAGCTSGHGICGIGRLSPRSIAAVIIFLSIAMATATGVSFL